MDMPPISTNKHPRHGQLISPTESKDLVNDYLRHVLGERTRQAGVISPYYQALWETIARLSEAGGKRLRPYMLLMAYQAYGGHNIKGVVPAAATQELLHLAMLMHDDIIDRELIRYGINNVSGWYEEHYKSLLSDEDERRHFADSAALLAGDLLVADSSLQLSLCDVSPELIQASQQILHHSIFRVVGGELLDTEASFRPARAIDPLTIAAEKTASYSFVGPLTMGATLAGASDRDISVLTHLGTTIGIAYQLRDDVMGIFGDAEVMGKTADGDLTEGKRTLLIEEFYKRATPQQIELFDNYFGNPDATADQLDQLRELITVSGAHETIEGYIQSHHLQAQELIASLTVAVENQQAFYDFVDRCLDRER